jgi:hypothetical protein
MYIRYRVDLLAQQRDQLGRLLSAGQADDQPSGRGRRHEGGWV